MLMLVVAAALADVPTAPPFESYAANHQRMGSDVCFPSGLRLTVLRDDRQPVVALTTVIDAGSASDPAGREGAAHLVEHLWFRARPEGRSVAHVLDAMGANYNATTLADTTVYSTVADVGATRDLLALEAHRLTQPLSAISPEVFDEERRIVGSELALRGFVSDDIPRFLPNLHGEQSVLRPRNQAAIDALTRSDLDTALAAYVPSTTTLQLTGPVQPSQVVEWMQEVFPASALFNDEGTPDVGCGPRLTEALAEPPPPASSDVPNVVSLSGLQDPVWMIGFSLPASYGANEPISRLATAWLWGRVDAALAKAKYRDVHTQCEYIPGARRAAAVCHLTLPHGLSGTVIRERVMQTVADVSQLESSARLVDFAAQRLRTDIALSLDLLSPLDSDDALRDALSNHYSGSPDWFTVALTATDELDNTQLATFAQQWLNPELARESVIVRPGQDWQAVMAGQPQEELELGEADSGGTRVAEWEQDAPAPHYISTREADLDGEREVARAQLAPATVERLPNGMQVIIVPHGDVPMVQTALRVGGARQTEAAQGLDAWAWDQLGIETHQFPNRSMRVAQDALSARFWMHNPLDARLIGTTGSVTTLDGQLWMLRNFADSAVAIDSLSYRQERAAAVRRTARKLDDWPSVVAGTALRTHVLGAEHPFSPSNYEALAAGSHSSFGKVKRHIRELWNPANATLYITGAVEPALTMEQVHRWFDTWEGRGGQALRSDRQATPARTERVAYTATVEDSDSARLTVGCRVDSDAGDAVARVGEEWLNDRVWTALRESDVGAYAPSVSMWDTGAEHTVWMQVTVPPERAAAAATALHGVLSEMQTGPDETAVKRVRQRLQFQWPQQYVDTQGVLTAMLRDGRQVQAMAQAGQRQLADVTAADVTSWAANCSPGAGLTVVGPATAPLDGTPWQGVAQPLPRLRALR